jgi:hypothetical protein
VGACGRRQMCLGVNQYSPRSMGYSPTHSSFVDSPTSFIDSHVTSLPHSVLEKSDPKECKETCEQTYSCDGKPATGKFKITRKFVRGEDKLPDGTVDYFTTGTAEKTNA